MLPTDPKTKSSVAEDNPELAAVASREYSEGFVTNIEMEIVPKGLSEDVVRMISAKKKEPEWLLEWRLKAYRAWLKMEEPNWQNVTYPKIDYQNLSYYAAPKSDASKPKSLDEIDPELLETYKKLGIPLQEQKLLAGIAVDAVFDSVSVATTYKGKLKELGIIFCSFSEAVHEHPELVRQYLGWVVPYTDNFFATLNCAVFSDGSFVYIPKGVRCPMELSTYFRINAAETGQFERTLIVADEGSYVSYLEGCTAPKRDENQLHAAVVELVALKDATIKYSTVQNWYPGEKTALSHRMSPETASTAMTPSVISSPSSLDAVMTTFPSLTTGEAQPFPGSAIFHATPRFTPHEIGTSFALETPCPSGPRNCGQRVARHGCVCPRSHSRTGISEADGYR
jgi:Fe-S cluster assembly protein SufB